MDCGGADDDDGGAGDDDCDGADAARSRAVGQIASLDSGDIESLLENQHNTILAQELEVRRWRLEGGRVVEPLVFPDALLASSSSSAPRARTDLASACGCLRMCVSACRSCLLPVLCIGHD